MTHYEVLGVPTGAAPADVRRAYLALARRHHPDFHTTSSPETRAAAEREMQRINEAWLVLGDTALRREYDAELADRASGVRRGGTSAPAGEWQGPDRDPRWRPGSGTAHPDFVPVDDEDDFVDEESRERWLESLDDTPIGGRRPVARWQQLAPVVLFLASLASLSVGLVVSVPALLGLGLILLVASGLAFVITPMLAVMRSYERDPRR